VLRNYLSKPAGKEHFKGPAVGDEVILPTVDIAPNAFCSQNETFYNKPAFAVTVNKSQRQAFILKSLFSSRTIKAAMSHARNSNRNLNLPRINFKCV
jgi:hypothetical protein